MMKKCYSTFYEIKECSYKGFTNIFQITQRIPTYRQISEFFVNSTNSELYI